MKLNRRIEVALNIFEYLYHNDTGMEHNSIRTIAQAIDEPLQFTRQVMHQLVCERITELVTTGHTAHYVLGNRAHLLTLKDLYDMYSPAREVSPLRSKYSRLTGLARLYIDKSLDTNVMNIVFRD